MRFRWGLLIIAVLAIVVAASPGLHLPAVAKPAPTPSPSPTNPPTPNMAPEQVTNGVWDMILQGQGYTDVTYSTMKLKDDGNKVTGVWIADKKTVYALSGTRDGTHIKLDISRQDKPDVVVGSMDATLDGIADMVGIITIGKIETPFQGAQHSRVPPPIEASPNPVESPSPF
jgi:hypothetical protein